MGALLIILLVCSFLALQLAALVVFYTREAELEAAVRYPKELREAVAGFLPILRDAKTRNDAKVLAAIEKYKDKHSLFEEVARGLIHIKFDYNKEETI